MKKMTILVRVPVILDPLCETDPMVDAERRLLAAIERGLEALQLPPGWAEVRLDEAYGVIDIGPPQPVFKKP